jgi:AraC-like DNA-binding protein
MDGRAKVERGSHDVAYAEIHGKLENKANRRPDSDVVVLSNIVEGSEFSSGAEALSVRYVARGRESYSIAGRGHQVEAGQVMIASHRDGAAGDVRNPDRRGTLGLCTLVHVSADDLEWLRSPLVMSAECTPLGMILHKGVETLWAPRPDKPEVAKQIIGSLRAELPNLAARVLSQAAAARGAKASTRFEMVRRAMLAQCYLHSTTGRSVDLNELARAVAVSPFHLLAGFQHCFGETPAAYHRKLRLKLAMEKAERSGIPISTVADEFGFAGGSSLSHAHKRAFGRPPRQRRSAAG